MFFDPMIRLYCASNLNKDSIIELEPDQAHYLNTVMRKNVGTEVLIFNGEYGEWQGRIDNLSKKSATVLLNHQTKKPKPEPDLWLAFAPIKKQRLDFLIEKACELGASKLLPVITKRTIVSKIRKNRLESQVVEACEQCERLSIPTVEDEQPLLRLLENWPEGRTLYVLNEQGGSKPFQDALGESEKEQQSGILVGPEGGFDRSELDLLFKKPFVTPVSLGPRILRAETAALSALTCWQTIKGDWLDPLQDRLGQHEEKN